MKKEMKPGNNYLLCNIDEPYAPLVFEAIMSGAEGWDEPRTFVQWVRATWGLPGITRLIERSKHPLVVAAAVHEMVFTATTLNILTNVAVMSTRKFVTIVTDGIEKGL